MPRLIKAEYLTEHVQSQTTTLSAAQRSFGDDPERRLALQVGAIGQLDTLRFDDDLAAESPLGEDEVEFKVMACSISSRDLASVLGKAEDAPLGLDAAGVVVRAGPSSTFIPGDKVFGLCVSRYH